MIGPKKIPSLKFRDKRIENKDETVRDIGNKKWRDHRYAVTVTGQEGENWAEEEPKNFKTEKKTSSIDPISYMDKPQTGWIKRSYT